MLDHVDLLDQEVKKVVGVNLDDLVKEVSQEHVDHQEILD